MKLYAVIVNGVHPVQCIVVWDVKANAQALSDHLNATISNNTQVQVVDTFWPNEMCEADKAWLTATDAYSRLEYLRGEIEKNRISFGEIVELESLAKHIAPDDVQLLDWAGVAEEPPV